jgi:hypothetical protein
MKVYTGTDMSCTSSLLTAGKHTTEKFPTAVRLHLIISTFKTQWQDITEEFKVTLHFDE